MFAACHMLHLCTHVDVIKLVQQVLSVYAHSHCMHSMSHLILADHTSAQFCD